MRVALVWLGAISRDTGGRTYLREILRPLGSLPDVELDVYLVDHDFAVPPECCVHYYPRAPAGPLGRIAMETLVVSQIRRRNYDVLFAPFNYLPMAWRGPSIVVQHNLLAGRGADPARGRLRAVYRRRAVASSVRRATYVIAVSDHLKDRILDWYPDVDPNRVRVVPLAPAPELVAAASPSVESRSRTVLVVSALSAHKGLEDAVDAFSIVAHGRAGLRLSIAGPGTRAAREAIVERAELRGVRERVELLGNLPHAHLAHRYRDADVLLFLSKIESFGLPVVEAMALGVPVVARRIPALSELAGDAPFWVDFEADPLAIARAVEEALSDRNARARAMSRGQSLTEGLSWERTAELTAHVLRDAVAERREHKGWKPLARLG